MVDNPPSYGRYEDDKNLLHIQAWAALAPGAKLEFRASLRCWAGDKPASRHLRMACITGFLFHELSHWWQACQHKTGENHYSVEYGANRIAAAYWRLKDPAFIERTAKGWPPPMRRCRIQSLKANLRKRTLTITTKS